MIYSGMNKNSWKEITSNKALQGSEPPAYLELVIVFLFGNYFRMSFNCVSLRFYGTSTST